MLASRPAMWKRRAPGPAVPAHVDTHQSAKKTGYQKTANCRDISESIGRHPASAVPKENRPKNQPCLRDCINSKDKLFLERFLHSQAFISVSGWADLGQNAIASSLQQQGTEADKVNLTGQEMRWLNSSKTL